MSRGYTDDRVDLVTNRPLFAGRVRRYHTWAVHHQQTIGEHCWQVARVYESIFGPPTAEVERYIRHHDTAELGVGDPPFPVKANSSMLKAEYDRLEADYLDLVGVEIPDVGQEEKRRVKVCDLIEMMEFGMVEREMGNVLAVMVVIRTGDAAATAAKALSEADALAVTRYIDRAWKYHEKHLRCGDFDNLYNQRDRGSVR